MCDWNKEIEEILNSDMSKAMKVGKLYAIALIVQKERVKSGTFEGLHPIGIKCWNRINNLIGDINGLNLAVELNNLFRKFCS